MVYTNFKTDTLHVSRILEHCNRLTESVVVRCLRYHSNLLNLNHVIRCLCAQGIHVDAFALFHAEDVLLAILREETALIVVVEEAV